MFASIFNPENGLWRLVAKFADVLALSVLWLLCSVPLVTLGAATAALYSSAVCPAVSTVSGAASSACFSGIKITAPAAITQTAISK